jgi:hypothetical protein
MKRAALLTSPALILLAASAFAGEPVSSPSPTPAKSKLASKKPAPKKTTADAKPRKTSPALDQLFDKDSPIQHPDLHFWGDASVSVTSIHR